MAKINSAKEIILNAIKQGKTGIQHKQELT